MTGVQTCALPISGNRSISNMFIDLGQGVQLTDEQFEAEMTARREKLHYSKNDVVLGCPLCNGDPIRPVQPKRPATSAGSGNNQ